MSDISMSVKHQIQTPRMFLHKSRTTIHPWRMIAKDYVGNRIILTHGFVKKTQKTLPREIERAKEYRALYQQREEHRHG